MCTVQMRGKMSEGERSKDIHVKITTDKFYKTDGV